MHKRSLLSAITLLFGILVFYSARSQDPARFQSEINRFKSDSTDYGKVKHLILFTGSSTIRMWTEVDKDLPDRKVLNRGFGGSFMSELLFYTDTVIVQCHPEKIFIYEGDNDIAVGKKPREIIIDAGKLVDLIHKKLPQTSICFIAAKPSISRWALKDIYLDFNRQLKEFTTTKPRVFYLDMWNMMMDAEGKPRADIFLADGLHMNRVGYDIWKSEVRKFLKSHRRQF
jgi:lysophospholipase L1-like esterase